MLAYYAQATRASVPGAYPRRRMRYRQSILARSSCLQCIAAGLQRPSPLRRGAEAATPSSNP
eukprot:3033150-Pleurochrysis_carterae.AAC.3